jgi:DNA modification methylase
MKLEEQEKWPVKEGEIWKLGKHYVYCRDSTKFSNYTNSLLKLPIKAIITDPPYNKLSHKIETKINFHDIVGIADYIINNGFFIFFGMQPSLSNFLTISLNSKFNFYQEIIWDKISASSYLRPINNIHENIIFLKKGQAKINKIRYPFHNETVDMLSVQSISTMKRYLSSCSSFLKNKEKIYAYLEYLEGKYAVKEQNIVNIVNDAIHLRKSLKRTTHLNEKLIVLQDGKKVSSLLRVMPHNKQRHHFNIPHPTVKPINLLEVLIELTTSGGDIIFDPFLGSGTTLLAAEKTHRICYGMEIFPEYCSIILERFHKETGKMPILTAAD